jgi:hypothetical protein
MKQDLQLSIKLKELLKHLIRLFETWKPRESFEVINATEFKGRVLNHSLIY